MSGDLQDDGVAAAGHIADVDPGCVRLPRPQVVQGPPGCRVGGVMDQLGELRVLAGQRYLVTTICYLVISNFRNYLTW